MTTPGQRLANSGPFTSNAVIVTVDVPSLAANTAVDVAVAVPGSEIGDSILVTPLGTWPAGLVLGSSRCLVAGTVQMRVANVTVGAIDPASQLFKYLLSHVGP